jgi:hypothetical protein
MSEKIGNWQTLGTTWDDKKIVLDANWSDDKCKIVMAIIQTADVTVGDVRGHLGDVTPEESETLEGAKKLALPILIDGVANIAQQDEKALAEYGIMIGAKIRDIAMELKPMSRDLDEISRP